MERLREDRERMFLDRDDDNRLSKSDCAIHYKISYVSYEFLYFINGDGPVRQ